ncbi:N-methylhydantoinase A [Novosphingobium sp. SG751A]|uniref:hydantoinase/oxoprolinase family protein n=1 Tax=Novosphingobium sp. SG751A TaxID=2587000 RepID=UPI00155256C6|nr:hydantoinase/oxoprolinase family protein [Novosphingobium sp. SG751A]NOW44981.1 N-methylhydantoinase A [Novosphingobium sp. SG751A]
MDIFEEKQGVTSRADELGELRREDIVAIGIDTGGTHTDLVLGGKGKLVTLKVPSTTHDLTIGILEGVKAIAQRAGFALSEINRFVYASTFVTNLFIEHKQTPVGLITTEGFRDVLAIGRASRKPDVYDIHWRPAEPLVQRHLRLGVIERMDHRGDIVEPLDEESVRAALRTLTSEGVVSVAVCLLHAYANPAHEQRIAEIANSEFPSLEISLSSDVSREFREYERTSTTCVSAFIKGPLRKHLASLSAALKADGVLVKPTMMQGNGGIATFQAAVDAPASVTHSGVMGGIVGAVALSAQTGIKNLISLDMGGTSADVSLIYDGKATLAHRSHVGPHPLIVPTLDMITIGAGGGSIAWIDGGTSLRVGPQSAGSRPGPACYAQGGTDATVSDANLVAGRLNADFFLAGARQLDASLSHKAVDQVASSLNISSDAAALGILAIAEAHMVNAIRLVSVERGFDPRDFTLVAFGGAGALHAVRLAEALSIKKVLIPPAPGNTSAMGLLSADTRYDFARTLYAPLDRAIQRDMAQAAKELLIEANAALEKDSIPAPQRRFVISLDLRYEGQNYELNLTTDEDEIQRGSSDEFKPLVDRFDAMHEQVYGYRLEGRSLKIVKVRVTSIGVTPHIVWPELASYDTASGKEPAPHRYREVLISNGTRTEIPVYRHEDLRAGQDVPAPAIVEYTGGTLFIPPQWAGHVDQFANLHLEQGVADASVTFEPALEKEVEHHA